MSQRAVCIKEHEELAAAGHPLHARIASEIERVLAEAQKVERVKKANLWRKSNVDRAEAAADFFIDYNTVEMILLYCCILVTLAAIMFTSVALEPLAQSTKDLENSLLTAATLFVIIGSLLYFLAVFVAEVYVTFFPHIVAERKRKRDAALAAKEAALGGDDGAEKGVKYAVGDGEGDGTVGINPLFARAAGGGSGHAQSIEELMAAGTVPNEAAWAAIRKNYEMILSNFDAAKRRVQELEVRLSAGSFAGGMAAAAQPKKKATFAPQRVGSALGSPASAAAATTTTTPAVAATTTTTTPAAAAADVVTEPTVITDDSLPEPWLAVMDPSSGRVYYVNADTDATSWTRPT